jgi:hypothetical protein
MLHKDYDRKDPVEKILIMSLTGLNAKMNWLAGSNEFTVALRAVGDDEKGTQRLGV